MPKKPAAIDASTLLATKGKAPVAVSGSLQRGQTVTETLVDLNFKVPPHFRQRFKRLAFEAQLKNVQLLSRALDAWEREQGRGGEGSAKSLNFANSLTDRNPG